MDELARRMSESRQAVDLQWDEARAQRNAHALQWRRTQHQRRRRQLQVAGGLAVAALALLALWLPMSPPVEPASAPGASWSFPDGSRALAVGKDTELTVAEQAPDVTRVRLARGAARFEVTPDTSREFTVEVAEVRVTVLGTVFEVRREQREVWIAVERGRVRVEAPDRSAELVGGEELRMALDSAPDPLADPAADTAVDPAPGKPVDMAPGKPVDFAPAKPVDMAPAKPVDMAPAKPVDMAPAKPANDNTAAAEPEVPRSAAEAPAAPPQRAPGARAVAVTSPVEKPSTGSRRQRRARPSAVPSVPPAAPLRAAPPSASEPSVPWRVLARDGDYDGAYDAMRAQGPGAVKDGAGDLMLAADVARLSGHPADAAKRLRTFLARHVRDPRAPLAAFTLGRVLLEELGRPADAARAFARARALNRQGDLAEDALAREVEGWARAGDHQQAHAAARRYIAAYPQGRRLRAVKRHGGLQ